MKLNKIISIILILSINFYYTIGFIRKSIEHEGTSYWMQSGQDNIRRILSIKNLEKQAKNVIIFIGDGMGMSTITAGRIFKGQNYDLNGEEYKLVFEKFPNTGFSKTYNVDRQVPDSAGTATSMFTGTKAQYKMLGLDNKSKYNKCEKIIYDNSKLTTLATYAQNSGMDTGFVTTTRITHATPGALYAHINNRDWECDTQIPNEYKECTKDIARQLVEDSPGNKFKVIMGGGGGVMGLDKEGTGDVCRRSDNQDLTKLWLDNNENSTLVKNLDELMSVNLNEKNKLMGIFSSDHLPYSAVKTDDVPSLANMTKQAIKFLSKNNNGFFLMVEGGKIDLAHHQNYAQLALKEVSELDDAVIEAMNNVNIDETLIIVTADHSHAFTMNGYPERGNDILGLAEATGSLSKYETLSYANGPGYFYHRINDTDSGKTTTEDTWRNLVNDTNRNDPFYRHFSPRYLKDETHGGEDVGVYAIGPYGHLFRSTFEQNYIAHVIAYAACLKDWPSHCTQAYNRYYVETTNSGSESILINKLTTILLSCIIIIIGILI